MTFQWRFCRTTLTTLMSPKLPKKLQSISNTPLVMSLVYGFYFGLKVPCKSDLSLELPFQIWNSQIQNLIPGPLGSPSSSHPLVSILLDNSSVHIIINSIQFESILKRK